MSNLDSPLISIIIPARNEAKDIAATLERVINIEYKHKEIIVVDDSTDETPQIVCRYASQDVRLIHREHNHNGCCGARNLGMKMARGEILVIFNADNRPHPDFLNRILKHYQNGADYVIVCSTVLNQDDPWGKFTIASGKLRSRNIDPEWSEGFSCRKTAAEKVGYIPGDFPIPFCRDYLIGVALNQAGFKKFVDFSIPVEHVVPESLSSYWHNQVWRGTFSAPYAYYFRQMSLVMIWIRELLKASRTTLKYLLILPVMWHIVRLSKYTSNGWRDIPALFFVGLVQDLATTSGNFLGLIRLKRAIISK